ncbi:carboxypeptidase-like regulatory domain-containing protein [Muricauda sp. CAU 1633]|uniref:carboxypeptidase-like regulatory domain-containing protein n=1 Tax=Allomuricauda sp. CAU 1633 TaxID=2816036 RepID=UPI001A90234B|nr:carboxypeptidase-like regulatory domain-containing protein [Muricauda sp. CAU 1633]MBO0321424.1 carboxypeptidase-like regulatory domain-containing protein [Muricauda sp. CAU 1633]
MKKYGALFIIFFVSLQFLHAQNFLSGKILDADTGAPVDYVNIGIVDQAKGTVSSDDGTFVLQLEDGDINDTNTVQFSRIGYETLQFNASELYKLLQENPQILMKEAFFELEGVTLNLKSAAKNRVGYVSNNKEKFAFWNDSLALGGEHASKIRIKNSPLKLEDMSFNVIASISDSILVRVNIYEVGKAGLPGKNISNHNILHTIKGKQGRVTIDLSPYNIVVKDHFIASLELLKIYGGKVGILISSFDDGARSFTRVISQDRWKRISKGTTIAFSLNTSQLEENQYNEVVGSQNTLREKPEKITLLWDTSYSMKGKNSAKELRFLDNYFNHLKNVDVALKTFGYDLGEVEQFAIENGNWESLKKRLLEIIYDGANRPEVLHELQPDQYTLLFTDGKGFPETLDEDWKHTVFTINSQSEANHELLKLIAEGSGANYINLDKIDDQQLALDYTKKHIIDNLEYAPVESNSNALREIKGTVTDFDDPLPNVTVKVRETSKTTKTNTDGNFSIMAHNGAIIEFTYPGRENAESVVNSNTDFLNITMPMGVKVLDEVILEEYLKAEAIKGADPQKTDITTNFGTIDVERTGFAIKQLQNDKVKNIHRYVSDVIKGKFPGVRVFGDDASARIAIRGGEIIKSYAAWDIDGLLYPPENPPLHINVLNVKSITIMPGSWAAARYGRIARGGIIIVKTINQSFEQETTNGGSHWDALRSNDIYKNDAVLFENSQGSQPKYIQWISGAKSMDEAYDVYIEQRKLYGHLPHFYIDVHSLFLQEWETEEVAGKILSNLEEVFSKDVIALRSLAYQLEEKGLFSEAHAIYTQIHTLQPAQAQSQRDLAHSYANLGEIQKAWSLYREYLMGIKELKQEGIDKIIKEEALTLIRKHHAELNLDVSRFSLENEPSDIELLVEWNNPNTEFELQFVGPTGHYYTWQHTKEANPSLISDEIFKGYSSTSFQIDDLAQGRWLLNVKYLGNQTNTPAFLKTTIKNNLTGTETIKVLRLQQKDVNFQFLNLSSDKISNFK